jgi:hypothetical protein
MQRSGLECMDAKSLKRLLPRTKDDAEGAKALVAIGYPTVEPVMPLMLDWLKTNGSPVELIMRDFFASLGTRAVPAVQKALASRHDGLKYSVLKHVVCKWPADAVFQLKVQLQGLATGSGFYGTDLIALRLLVEHQLAEPAWLNEWSEFKIKRLRELLGQAEHIRELLAK